MVECRICNSQESDNYIYTQCNHFICLQCASTLWDHRYSLKCCSKTTFLQEETCLILRRIVKGESLPITRDYQENKSIINSRENTKPPQPIIKEDDNLENKDMDQSVYLTDREARTVHKYQSNSERKEDPNLLQMEAVVNQSVDRIKFNFQMYRKELEKKQEIVLKDVYDHYSDHLRNITSFSTEEDVKTLKDKLSRTIEDAMSKLTFKESKLPQKQDKILQKLEYNQLKMKQKLTRHYQLLK